MTKPKQPHPTGEQRGAKGCAARTRGGALCRTAAVRGTDRCLFHTEGAASGCGKIGGARRAIYDLSKLTKFDPPRDSAEMRAILATMVIEMRTGQIDPHLATRIAVVATAFLKANENEELKKVYAEIEEVKRRLGEQEEARRRRGR